MVALQILTLNKEREPWHPAVRILESAVQDLQRIEFITTPVEKEASASNLTIKLLIITTKIRKVINIDSIS